MRRNQIREPSQDYQTNKNNHLVNYTFRNQYNVPSNL